MLKIFHAYDPYPKQFLESLLVRLRKYEFFEAEGLGFASAGLGLEDAADLAGQADLSENGDVGRDLQIAKARGDGGDNAQVGGRLVDLHSAGDVYKDVIAG